MGRPLNIHRLGGAIAKAGQQLTVKANIDGTVISAGLLQQKKQRTFRVVAANGDTGLCTLVDSAIPALGEMSLKITPATGPAFFAAKITNRYVWDFDNDRFMWSFIGDTSKVEADAS